MSFSVEESLDRYIAAVEKEREPDGFWHPSSISGCARQALYAFTGVPKSNPLSARTKRIFRVGHLLHEFIQDAIRADESVDRFYPEIEIEYPEMRVKGNADGIIQLKDGTWQVLEFKTINSMAFKYGGLPKPEHITQLSTYIWAIRANGATYRDGNLMGNIAPLDELDRGRIAYVSKDDLRVEEFNIFYTEEREIELAKKVQELQLHADNETLPGRLPMYIKKNDWVRAWQCGYCAWQDTCWEEA